MTREEAIDYLVDPIGKREKHDEAIRMAIEALERKHGEWIPVTNGRGGFECSECHSYAPSYKSGDDNLSNYCPNCGAKIGERREDGDNN